MPAVCSLPRSRRLSRMPVLAVAAAFGAMLSQAQPAEAGQVCPSVLVSNSQNAGQPASITTTYYASAGDVLTVEWGPGTWTTAAISGDLSAGPVNYPGPLSLTFPGSGAFSLTVYFTSTDTGPIQRTLTCTHVEPAAVPTLGTYGMALLTLSLLALGALARRRS